MLACVASAKGKWDAPFTTSALSHNASLPYISWEIEREKPFYGLV